MSKLISIHSLSDFNSSQFKYFSDTKVAGNIVALQMLALVVLIKYELIFHFEARRFELKDVAGRYDHLKVQNH